MSDEASHLAETLLFTLGVITSSNSEDLKRIAAAYHDAQQFVTSIHLESASARPRIVTCLEQFKIFKAADDVAAAGWMLAAIQLRISEQELPEWDKLKVVADSAVELLPVTRRIFH